MKKKSALLGALIIAFSFTACGNETQSNVEQLKQTGKISDYSSNVELGAYKGLSAEVISSEVTDEDLAVLVEDIIYNYYSLAVSSETDSYEWTDEMAKTVSNGKYNTTKEYESYLKETMEAELKAQQEQEFISEIWTQILENSTFTGISEEEIEASAENYYENQKAEYEYYATYYSYSYENYLSEKIGITDEELKENSYEIARLEKERIIASSAIYYTENLELTDEEFSEGVAKLLETYTGYDSSAEFVETFGEDYIREYLVSQKVNEYLKSVNEMVVTE